MHTRALSYVRGTNEKIRSVLHSIWTRESCETFALPFNHAKTLDRSLQSLLCSLKEVLGDVSCSVELSL